MAEIGDIASKKYSLGGQLPSVTDLRNDRGLVVNTTENASKKVQQILGSGEVSTIRYKMRAVESGGGCVGVIYRTWEVTGSPDLTGASYVGTRCSPPGTFSDVTIIAIYE